MKFRGLRTLSTKRKTTTAVRESDAAAADDDDDYDDGDDFDAARPTSIHFSSSLLLSLSYSDDGAAKLGFRFPAECNRSRCRPDGEVLTTAASRRPLHLFRPIVMKDLQFK